MAQTLREKITEKIAELGLSTIESKDLEIGIYNATIDHCNTYKIPLFMAMRPLYKMLFGKNALYLCQSQKRQLCSK